MGLPGDDSTTTTSDPDDTTTTTTTSDPGDTTTTSDPGDTTTTSDPDDTTTTSDPGGPTTTSTDPGGTTTSTSGPGDTTTTSDPDDTTTTSEPGDTTTTSDPDDTTTTSEPGDTTTTSDPGETTTTDEPGETTTTDEPGDTTTTTDCSPGTTNGGGGGGGPTVSILNFNRDATTSLRVGKWGRAFDPEDGKLQPNFVDLDLDSFYVRVVDKGAKQETIQVTLQTDSPGISYDDGPVTLDLRADRLRPGQFESMPLLLVSNRADDEQSTGKKNGEPIKDNAPNDRSFRVALGAKVTASYNGTPAIANVSPGFEVKLHITALTFKNDFPSVGEPFLDKPVMEKYNGRWDEGEEYRDTDGKGTLWDPNPGYTSFLDKDNFERRVREDIQYSNEVFAQIGIRLVTDAKKLVDYRVADEPLEQLVTGEVAVGGGNLGKLNKLTPEEQALHDKPALPAEQGWYSADTKDVEVFHVPRIPARGGDNKIIDGEIYAGWAFTVNQKGQGYKDVTNKQFNDSLLVSNFDPLFVLAHEVYHVIAQQPFHVGTGKEINFNLMRNNQQIPVLDEKLKVTDSRRLTDDQARAIEKRYLR